LKKRYVRRMRALFALALVAGVGAGSARAGELTAELATQVGIPASAVHGVSGYLLHTADFTHAVIGRFDVAGATSQPAGSAVAILKCTGECVGRRVELGTVDGIAVLGIVDLQGDPKSLGLAIVPVKTGYAKIGGNPRMKFPVLAVQTTELITETTTRGARPTTPWTRRWTRTNLYLISLVGADRGSIVYQDTDGVRSPRRLRMTRSFRFERGEPKGSTNLDLVITETAYNGCPGPEARYTLENHRYRLTDYRPATGC